MVEQGDPFEWRLATSPLADPDDEQWIHVDGGGLRHPLYLRIARTGTEAQPFGGSDLVVTGLLINNGQPVSSSDLRLPLQRILEQFRQHLRSQAEGEAAELTAHSTDDMHYLASGMAEYDAWVALMEDLPTSDPAPRGRGAPAPTTEELRSFAAVYAQERQAGSRGSVTRTAKRFGMHRVTAHKWIHRCREAGILPSEESD